MTDKKRRTRKDWLFRLVEVIRGKIMLVLSRKVGERIWIGEDISVTVVRITGGGVRLGIEAPNELPVVREELKKRLEEELNQDADADSPMTDSLGG